MYIIDRNDIFRLIEEERERQDKLHPMPKIKNSENRDVSAFENLLICNEFLAILVEEIGEVGSALQGDGSLKEELIQVASVAIRWLENIK